MSGILGIRHETLLLFLLPSGAERTVYFILPGSNKVIGLMVDLLRSDGYSSIDPI